MYNYAFFYDGSGDMNPLKLAFAGVLTVLAIWSLVWKGFALWKAARSGSKWWFVILLIVNTAGILDILYIYIFSKRGTLKKMMEPAKPVSSDPSDPKDATLA